MESREPSKGLAACKSSVVLDGGNAGQRKTAITRPRERLLCPIAGCNAEMLKKLFHRHMRTVHRDGDLFECDSCALSFRRKDSLTRHQKEQHSSDNVLEKCGRCGQRVVPRALKDHLSSRRCRASSDPDSTDELAPFHGHYLCVRDGNSALLLSARYLVEIRHDVCDSGARRAFEGCRGFSPVRLQHNVPLLEARQQAVRALTYALNGSEVGDLTAAAIWTFGVADIIMGESPRPHSEALSKIQLFRGSTISLDRVLKAAFRQLSPSGFNAPYATIVWTEWGECDDSRAQRKSSLNTPLRAPSCLAVCALAGFRLFRSAAPLVSETECNWLCSSLRYEEDWAVEKASRAVARFEVDCNQTP